MIKNSLILLGLALILLRLDASTNTNPPAEAIEPVKLGVAFKGVRSLKGKILVWVFASEKGFPVKPEAALKSFSVPLVDGLVPRIEILGLPPGSYAVSAVHDENDNQLLDTNWIGIPREGVAASRDAKGIMGPPKFRDAVLELTQDQEIEITFTY